MFSSRVIELFSCNSDWVRCMYSEVIGGACVQVCRGASPGVRNVTPASARAQLERHPALVRYVERMLADVFGAPLPAAPAVQAADWGPRAEPGAARDPPDAKPWWCARRAAGVSVMGLGLGLPGCRLPQLRGGVPAQRSPPALRRLSPGARGRSLLPPLDQPGDMRAACRTRVKHRAHPRGGITGCER